MVCLHQNDMRLLYAKFHVIQSQDPSSLFWQHSHNGQEVVCEQKQTKMIQRKKICFDPKFKAIVLNDA